LGKKEKKRHSIFIFIFENFNIFENIIIISVELAQELLILLGLLIFPQNQNTQERKKERNLDIKYISAKFPQPKTNKPKIILKPKNK